MSRSSKPPEQKVINSTSYVFSFGKYKGMNIEMVLKIQPDYILWMQDNSLLDFDHKIIDLAEDTKFNP